MPNLPILARTAVSPPQPVRISPHNTNEFRPESNRIEQAEHPTALIHINKNRSKLSNTIHPKRTILCKTKEIRPLGALHEISAAKLSTHSSRQSTSQMV